MVRYVKFWGGGTNAYFIKRLNFFAMTGVVPISDRHISGSAFDAFAKLDLPPNNLPTHFVNAALLVHAAGNVVDGVCRFLTLGDIANIKSKYLKEASNANAIIVNAVALVKDSGITPTIEANLFFNLFKNTVCNVLHKEFEGTAPPDTLEKCASEFAKEFANATGSLLPHVATPPPEETRTSSVTNIAETNEIGVIVGGGRQTVMSKGFHEDSVVSLIDRGSSQRHKTQYEIKAIDADGNVTLAQLDCEGKHDTDTTKHVVVEFNNFLRSYKTVSSKNALLVGWPSIQPKLCTDFKNVNCKAMIQSALYALEMLTRTPSVRIQTHPALAVFSNDEATLGTMKLVPSTLAISVELDAKKPLPAKTIIATMSGNEHRYILTRTASKTFANPFWNCLTVTDDKSTAHNFELVDTTVQCHSPAVNNKRAYPPTFVTIPVAVNIKEIKIGDELVILKRAEAVSTKEKMFNFNMGDDAAKKRKGG